MIRRQYIKTLLLAAALLALALFAVACGRSNGMETKLSSASPPFFRAGLCDP